MTELLETVTANLSLDADWVCPFDHEATTHDKKNTLPPPPRVNNASTLSDNLKDRSARLRLLKFDLPDFALEDTPIQFPYGGRAIKKYEARYTAHHLLPGNDVWNDSKNQLRKWIEKTPPFGESDLVEGDVGYDVNHYGNGIDLPGNKAVRPWTTRAGSFQNAYAFAAMEANDVRQFHDAHLAYSEFVLKAMNRLAQKLKRKGPDLGCGKKRCPASNKKPYPPPYFLVPRLHAIGARLANYLIGDPAKWRRPLFTSRFALMFQSKKVQKTDMSQAEATDQLDVSRFA